VDDHTQCSFALKKTETHNIVLKTAGLMAQRLVRCPSNTFIL